MKYAYFVVEGQHDVAIIGRILEHLHGAEQIRTVAKMREIGVYEFWKNFINLKFPYEDKRPKLRGKRKDEGDFTKRMPVPAFFQLGEYSIAVHSAGGSEEEIANTIYDSFLNWDDADTLSAMAVFCDADEQEPNESFAEIKGHLEKMADLSTVIQNFGDLTSPGEVLVEELVRVGVYVFPDNENMGTLEHVLIDCASTSYSDLLGAARDYVGLVHPTHGTRWNTAKKMKVTIGCVANVLQPGAANQVSIQKDNWISTDTLPLAHVGKLNRFITQTLNLS